MFNRLEMIDSLQEFVSVYERRPIKNNDGGMASPHLFLFWHAMRMLRPRVVIESGVWQGQGTWLIEQSCDADIYAIDLDWSHLQYRSARAKYLSEDFGSHDWSKLPKESTLVFFDDHVDALKRCETSRRHGFRHLLFEDNYPAGRGDCYSLQQVFAHAGHQGRTDWRARLGRLLGRIGDHSVAPNARDAEYVRSISEEYEVLPPVFRRERTRWGDAWPDAPQPLLSDVSADWQRVYLDEADSYTWMCYLRLKPPGTP